MIFNMGIITSQQLTAYYDQYRDSELTFTKDIIRILKLEQKHVQIKYTVGEDVVLTPCILHSTSFQKANIIIPTNGDAFAFLAAKEPPTVQLKMGFVGEDGKSIQFFIGAKVAEKSLYTNSKELAVVTLKFTQRPPDDLIEIMGRLLEANANAIRRREERIVINDDSKRKLGLAKEECVVAVSGVPRHCILRDISFMGAKVVLVGLHQLVVNKDAELKLRFIEPNEELAIKGMIVSADVIEGRKDICTASIKFDENLVPLEYKLHVNSYLTTVRKQQLSASDQIALQKQKQQEMMAQQN